MLAVCKQNLLLLSCARGHVARLSVTNVVASRHQHGWGWTRPPEEHGHQILQTKTVTKSFQRLNPQFSSAGARPACVHLLSDPTSRERTSVEASPECIIKSTLRTTPLPAFNRPKLHSSYHSFQLHPCTWLSSDWVHAGALSGVRSYSTVPEPQVQKPSDQEDKRDEATHSASSAPPSNQGSFKELYENPWTIPNFLCMARIVLSPVLGYLIMEQYFHISLGLFVLAGATDLLDGYIARNWPNQKSALGSALDPLADKILISVLYVSLTYAQLIPVPLTALVICRDVALIAAVFYVRYKTVPPPVTLSKFFNPCYTTAQLKPTLISKVNTAVQLLLVAVSLASPIFHYTDSVLLQSLWYFTALTTAASGYSYFHYGRKTVEVLNKTK
ncbi:cardiolipin synthase (CMP-forming) [Astyanax mexicanus]|uniref:cardiolipin synthase (CMP-forming) n=1 Tax=Astyanax mexicanus TaxID=7994 RepID=UPI0020CACAA2|nr:cardiolipin synthase (CMP-forming) [Astyanax mexicanus]